MSLKGTFALDARGFAVAKQHTRNEDGEWQTVDYPEYMKQIVVGEEEWPSFPEFCMRLREMAEDTDGYFLIRGERKAKYKEANPVRRLYHDREEKGKVVEGIFQDVDCGWIMVDVDNFPNEWGAPSSIEELSLYPVLVAEQIMPPEFEGKAFWYQWSNSAFLKGWDYLKLHLFYHIEPGWTTEDLRQWATQWGRFDPAPFNPVQPHFIANPIFKSGEEDFLGEYRTGWVDGCLDPVAIRYIPLPPDDFQRKQDDRAVSAELERVRKALVRSYPVGSGMSAEMKSIGLIGIDGHCHEAIRRSSGVWARVLGSGACYNTWSELVRERVQISSSTKKGRYMSDGYLRDVWRSAQAKYGGFDSGLSKPKEMRLTNNNSYKER